MQIEAFEAIALRAHQAPFQVVKLYAFGRYIGGVLQVKHVLGGVGVEQVGKVSSARKIRCFPPIAQAFFFALQMPMLAAPEFGNSGERGKTNPRERRVNQLP